MRAKKIWRYLGNSIRVRVFCSLLVAVPIGLGLAWASLPALTTTNLLPAEGSRRLVAMHVLTFLYTAVLLTVLVPVILQPVRRLNQLLRQVKSREGMQQLDPAEFAEMGPLLETMVDYLDRADNQQKMLTAIHHAFRKKTETLEYDALTGLYNHHYLKTILPLQIAHMANLKDNLSGIMLDVDHFKHYNDTSGHPAGDKVLAKVAEILRKCVRENDICCRYGGEEFFITLPNANGDRAHVIAERIRQAIEQCPFAHGERQPGGRLTVSLGVATYPTHAVLSDDLIQCADEALYLAKHRGRNRTCTYEGTPKIKKVEEETTERAGA